MKESIKKEEIPFDAKTVTDIIWSKIQAKYIETINNKKQQEWFSITCPIEHTIKERHIEYKLIIDDKAYNDVDFKELYDLTKDCGLLYYINEENIRFYISNENLGLIIKHKKMLEEGLSPSLILKRVKENISKSE